MIVKKKKSLIKIKKIKTITKYEMPKEIFFFNQLKTTKNGKLIRSLE